MQFSIILAHDELFGIGRGGKIPWKCDADMKHFRDVTKTAPEGKINAIIMGRKTYESVGRPLPGRINVVISNTISTLNGIPCMKSLNDALKYCAGIGNINSVFLCGGAALYDEGMCHPLLDKVYITEISGKYDCDVTVRGGGRLSAGDQISIITWIDPKTPLNTYNIINSDEEKYKSLIYKIINTGELEENRTGISAKVLFSQNLRFSLLYKNRDLMIIPLLTTKKVNYNAIVNELFWFLKGGITTDGLNSAIWKGNSSREFLDATGKSWAPEGYVGPIYGAQWRNFGNTFNLDNSILTNVRDGVDQIAQLIDGIKKDPTGRRHIVTAWNPKMLNYQALPPCHILQVYHVGMQNGWPSFLDIAVTMRSADMGLGVPFNIASYAILAHMVAKVCGLKARELTLNMVNCHIYENHIEPLREQLNRPARGFPNILFSDNINKKNDLSIDDFSEKDITLVNYYPHNAIKMDMAV